MEIKRLIVLVLFSLLFITSCSNDKESFNYDKEFSSPSVEESSVTKEDIDISEGVLGWL